MTDIFAALRGDVVLRADNRCEYCGLSQIGQEATFHTDHVKPRAENGPTHTDNLALACVSCSLRKGARTHVNDPDTQQEVPLFNPREDRWKEHFRWDAERIIGLTAVGRATIKALNLNRPLILEIRREEMLRGRHQPPSSAA